MALLTGKRSTFNYLTPEGLEMQTGSDKQAFQYFVAKELMDNAIDACEYAPFPKVNLQVSSEKDSLKIAVSDNGEGLSASDIDKIRQCFQIIPSGKYFRKIVTRGAIGNAWACMLGIAYATSKRNTPVHASICSARASADLTVKYDVARDTVDVVLAPRRKSVTTKITLYTGKPTQAGYFSFSLKELVKQYRLLNPHVEINASFDVEKNNWRLKFPIVNKCGARKRATSRSNIWLYSFEEFIELVYAHLRLLGETGELSVSQLVQREFEDVELKRVNRNALGKSLQLETSKTSLRQVYDAIRSASQTPTYNLTGLLNKHTFKKAVMQAYGKAREVEFVEHKQCAEVDGNYLPILLQVGLADVPALGIREICIGVNHGPKPAYPFLYPEAGGEQDRIYLNEILLKNQVTKEKPALLLINIISPNLRYLDTSKRELDLEGIGRTLKPVIEQAIKNYPKWRRRALGFGRATPIRQLLREELKRREKMRSQSKDGTIAEDEILPQQALWYKLRFELAKLYPKIVENTGKMRDWRNDFPTIVVAEASKLGRTREELGIYAAARAEQYFRNKVTSISWREVEALAKQGCDVIFIEKEGIAEALAPFAMKRGIAVINSRGYASHYASRLMRIAREGGANGFVLTDLDIDGLQMARGVPRIGVDDDLLNKLGLDRLAVAEPNKLKKGDPAKLEKLSISPELKDFLRTRRIELDSVLGAVGAERMWKSLEERILETSPVRDLTRSVDPHATVTEVDKHIAEISELLEKLGEPLKAKILSDSKLHRFRGFYDGTRTIDNLEQELEAEIEHQLRSNKIVGEVINKLSEAEAVIRGAALQKRRAKKVALEKMFSEKEIESIVFEVMEEPVGPLAKSITKDIMRKLKKSRPL